MTYTIYIYFGINLYMAGYCHGAEGFKQWKDRAIFLLWLLFGTPFMCVFPFWWLYHTSFIKNTKYLFSYLFGFKKDINLEKLEEGIRLRSKLEKPYFNQKYALLIAKYIRKQELKKKGSNND